MQITREAFSGSYLLVSTVDSGVVAFGCWTDVMIAVHMGARSAYWAVARASVLRKKLEQLDFALGHRDGFKGPFELART